MDMTATLHERIAFNRRVRRLSSLLGEFLSPCATVLDVGCGDGQISRNLMQLNPGMRVTGIDVLLRPTAAIPVIQHDGSERFPFGDRSFEAALLVDVLHHTLDPALMLAEARRVASRLVVIKDHCRDGLLAGPTLRAMDWLGNDRHGVALPYNYWPKERWELTFADLGLSVRSWETHLGLYAAPLRPLFERRLHFVSVLAVK
jgi:SAM-dependent methyltransferase